MTAGAHASPTWVGGCRPLELRPILDARLWRTEHARTITSYGIASDVHVAKPVAH